MKKTKLLLVSPCHGTYGGIEAFVLAVADAIRTEPDFDVRICFKKTSGFALHPDLAKMLPHDSVAFVERGGRELIDAIRWADVIHLQNASPDVVLYAKFLRKPIALTIHNYMSHGASIHRWLWRISARLADARWYNSNFVWRTWEGDRKRPGEQENTDRVETARRLDASGRAPGICFCRAVDCQ